MAPLGHGAPAPQSALKATRPAERLPSATDPAMFAYGVLQLVNQVHGSSPSLLEQIREGIRQPAAGPED